MTRPRAQSRSCRARGTPPLSFTLTRRRFLVVLSSHHPGLKTGCRASLQRGLQGSHQEGVHR